MHQRSSHFVFFVSIFAFCFAFLDAWYLTSVESQTDETVSTFLELYEDDPAIGTLFSSNMNSYNEIVTLSHSEISSYINTEYGIRLTTVEYESLSGSSPKNGGSSVLKYITSSMLEEYELSPKTVDYGSLAEGLLKSGSSSVLHYITSSMLGEYGISPTTVEYESLSEFSLKSGGSSMLHYVTSSMLKEYGISQTVDYGSLSGSSPKSGGSSVIHYIASSMLEEYGISPKTVKYESVSESLLKSGSSSILHYITSSMLEEIRISPTTVEFESLSESSLKSGGSSVLHYIASSMLEEYGISPKTVNYGSLSESSPKSGGDSMLHYITSSMLKEYGISPTTVEYESVSESSLKSGSSSILHYITSSMLEEIRISPTTVEFESLSESSLKSGGSSVLHYIASSMLEEYGISPKTVNYGSLSESSPKSGGDSMLHYITSSMLKEYGISPTTVEYESVSESSLKSGSSSILHYITSSMLEEIRISPTTVEYESISERSLKRGSGSVLHYVTSSMLEENGISPTTVEFESLSEFSLSGGSSVLHYVTSSMLEEYEISQKTVDYESLSESSLKSGGSSVLHYVTFSMLEESMPAVAMVNDVMHTSSSKELTKGHNALLEPSLGSETIKSNTGSSEYYRSSGFIRDGETMALTEDLSEYTTQIKTDVSKTVYTASGDIHNTLHESNTVIPMTKITASAPNTLQNTVSQIGTSHTYSLTEYGISENYEDSVIRLSQTTKRLMENTEILYTHSFTSTAFAPFPPDEVDQTPLPMERTLDAFTQQYSEPILSNVRSQGSSIVTLEHSSKSSTPVSYIDLHVITGNTLPADITFSQAEETSMFKNRDGTDAILTGLYTSVKPNIDISLSSSSDMEFTASSIHLSDDVSPTDTSKEGLISFVPYSVSSVSDVIAGTKLVVASHMSNTNDADNVTDKSRIYSSSKNVLFPNIATPVMDTLVTSSNMLSFGIQNSIIDISTASTIPSISDVAETVVLEASSSMYVSVDIVEVSGMKESNSSFTENEVRASRDSDIANMKISPSEQGRNNTAASAVLNANMTSTPYIKDVAPYKTETDSILTTTQDSAASVDFGDFLENKTIIVGDSVTGMGDSTTIHIPVNTYTETTADISASTTISILPTSTSIVYDDSSTHHMDNSRGITKTDFDMSPSASIDLPVTFTFSPSKTSSKDSTAVTRTTDVSYITVISGFLLSLNSDVSSQTADGSKTTDINVTPRVTDVSSVVLISENNVLLNTSTKEKQVSHDTSTITSSADAMHISPGMSIIIETTANDEMDVSAAGESPKTVETVSTFLGDGTTRGINGMALVSSSLGTSDKSENHPNSGESFDNNNGAGIDPTTVEYGSLAEKASSSEDISVTAFTLETSVVDDDVSFSKDMFSSQNLTSGDVVLLDLSLKSEISIKSNAGGTTGYRSSMFDLTLASIGDLSHHLTHDQSKTDVSHMVDTVSQGIHTPLYESNVDTSITDNTELGTNSKIIMTRTGKSQSFSSSVYGMSENYENSAEKLIRSTKKVAETTVMTKSFWEYDHSVISTADTSSLLDSVSHSPLAMKPTFDSHLTLGNNDVTTTTENEMDVSHSISAILDFATSDGIHISSSMSTIITNASVNDEMVVSSSASYASTPKATDGTDIFHSTPTINELAMQEGTVSHTTLPNVGVTAVATFNAFSSSQTVNTTSPSAELNDSDTKDASTIFNSENVSSITVSDVTSTAEMDGHVRAPASTSVPLTTSLTAHSGPGLSRSRTFMDISSVVAHDGEPVLPSKTTMDAISENNEISGTTGLTVSVSSTNDNMYIPNSVSIINAGSISLSTSTSSSVMNVYLFTSNNKDVLKSSFQEVSHVALSALYGDNNLPLPSQTRTDSVASSHDMSVPNSKRISDITVSAISDSNFNLLSLGSSVSANVPTLEELSESDGMHSSYHKTIDNHEGTIDTSVSLNLDVTVDFPVETEMGDPLILSTATYAAEKLDTSFLFTSFISVASATDEMDISSPLTKNFEETAGINITVSPEMTNGILSKSADPVSVITSVPQTVDVYVTDSTSERIPAETKDSIFVSAGTVDAETTLSTLLFNGVKLSDNIGTSYSGSSLNDVSNTHVAPSTSRIIDVSVNEDTVIYTQLAINDPTVTAIMGISTEDRLKASEAQTQAQTIKTGLHLSSPTGMSSMTSQIAKTPPLNSVFLETIYASHDSLVFDPHTSDHLQVTSTSSNTISTYKDIVEIYTNFRASESVDLYTTSMSASITTMTELSPSPVIYSSFTNPPSLLTSVIIDTSGLLDCETNILSADDFSKTPGYDVSALRSMPTSNYDYSTITVADAYSKEITHVSITGIPSNYVVSTMSAVPVSGYCMISHRFEPGYMSIGFKRVAVDLTLSSSTIGLVEVNSTTSASCAEKCSALHTCVLYSISQTGVCRITSECQPAVEPEANTYLMALSHWAHNICAG